MASPDRQVLQDAQGRFFCGKCGTLRNGRGSLFSDLDHPEQGVRAHLRHCRGVAGVQAKVEDLASRLASPAVAPVDPLPGVQPAVTARHQPGNTRVQPATLHPYRPLPYRVAGLSGSIQPGGDMVQKLAEMDAKLYAMADQLDVQGRQIAADKVWKEEALVIMTNEQPHQTLAQIQNQTSPWVYVGAAVVLVGGIMYFAGFFDRSEPAAAMGRSYEMGRAERPPARSSGLVEALEVGSKMMGFVKNARGAFKI